MRPLAAVVLLFAVSTLTCPAEPLPDGAVLRLGTNRLRHAGLQTFALLPDGKTIVSAGSDGLLRYWDVATGDETRTVALPTGSGGTALFSANAATLAVETRDKLAFYDPATGKERAAIELGPDNHFVVFTLSADGKSIARVANGRQEVVVRETDTGKIRIVLELPQGFYSSDFQIALSPDGKHLAVGGGSTPGPLSVFDVAAAKRLYTLHRAHAFAIAADGKQLVLSHTGDDGLTLRRHDLLTGTETAAFPVAKTNLGELNFSPDGRLLVHGTYLGGGCVHASADGSVVQRLPGRVLHPVFTPDGKVLIYRDGYTPRLRVVDLAGGKERHPPAPDLANGLVLSADGKTLAAVGWGEEAVVWDTTTGRPRPLDAAGVRGVMFAADGQALFAVHNDETVSRLDLATGRRRPCLLTEPAEPEADNRFPWTRRPGLDGRTIAGDRSIATPQDTKIRLRCWDAATGRLTREHTLAYLWNAHWLADGETLITMTQQGITFRDADTAAERRHLDTRVEPFWGYASSSDGRLFAGSLARGAAGPGAKSADGSHVGVWETASGRQVAEVATGLVSRVALSADGRRLVLLDGKSLRVRDLALGKEILSRDLPLPGVHRPFGWLRELVVSADGRRAVTTQPDGTALVWDLDTKPPPLGRPPTEADLARRWDDLGKDAPVAYAALWRLGEAPAATLPLLRRQFRPVVFDADAFRRRLADLDAEDFDTRQAAEESLSDLGDTAVPALRTALRDATSVEVRARLRRLLDRPRGLVVAPAILRQLRAVQLLESLGTPEARRLLGELASGASDAELTRAARAAAVRLGESPPGRE